MKEKCAPILKASTRDDKTRGVKDIRAFLGSCNFYKRHIPTFTYSSHLLTDLTKKRYHGSGHQSMKLGFRSSRKN